MWKGKQKEMTEIEQNMSENEIMGGRDIIVQDGGTITKPPVVNKRLDLPPPLILQQHILILNITSIIFRIFSMLNLMFLFST